MDELYSYDKYKGYGIFISEHSGAYYADIYYKGKSVLCNEVQGITSGICLFRCKSWIREELKKCLSK